jgi:hypothetical protein
MSIYIVNKYDDMIHGALNPIYLFNTLDKLSECMNTHIEEDRTKYKNSTSNLSPLDYYKRYVTNYTVHEYQLNDIDGSLTFVKQLNYSDLHWYKSQS